MQTHHTSLHMCITCTTCTHTSQYIAQLTHTHNAYTHLQLTMYVHTHTGWGHLKDILCDAALGTFTRQSDPTWQPCSPPHGHLTGIPCQYSLVLGLGEMVHSVLTNSGRQVITRLLSTSRCNKVTLNSLLPCFQLPLLRLQAWATTPFLQEYV